MTLIRTTIPLLLCLFLASCGSAPKSSTAKLSSPAVIEAKMVDAMKWQEANPIGKDPTDWTNGAYYTGVARSYESTGNPVFLKALEDMGGRTDWKTYNRYFHADDVAIAYSYLTVNEENPAVVNLEPTGQWLQDHLYKDHKWKEGNTEEMEPILWWWCDALFMAPPVIVRWSNLKNDRKYLDDMHKYYTETYDLLYDQEEHLFARDNRFLWTGSDDDRKGANGKKIFWSRGNGWVMGGLAMMLEEMPKDWEHYGWYLDLYKEMAAKVKSIQPADGLWRVSLLDPGAFDHGETSGSGFYTFALAWGINNGVLDKKEYGPAVKKAWAALETVQLSDGKIGWVQNIGYDPRPASADSWQNFGTGAFLMAGSEVRKMK
ncbi:glycoside hydrolase family 88/105 protein [Neolewinella antarctica]|uniref:Rhamnogalacturonyl hydrolase YesR n=1 Tax=Neolewinella antarctica TaxID=442734 RepID=A0ABX0XCB3_9BACT|nr:glycoside hydrolase family 88 protein [Neolewinella antarctica]NJC26895.1 rhamnogalacturonyl hydrolase YesR [Neolewinella antarctica]